MPREAAIALAVRLCAKSGIEQVQTHGQTLREIVEGIMKQAGIFKPIAPPPIGEREADDYHVMHKRGESSLHNYAIHFAEALLGHTTFKVFDFEAQKILWTHPAIIERMRETPYFRNHPNELRRRKREFEDYDPARPPQSNYMNVRDYDKTTSRSILALFNVARNISIQEKMPGLIPELEALCRVIADERRQQKSRVNFEIKVRTGTTDPSEMRGRPILTKIKVTFKKAG